MKKLAFVYIVIILSLVRGSAQDYEPAQRQFIFNGSNRYLSANMPEFKQRNFMLGWHWGADYRISKAELYILLRHLE